MTPRLEPAKVGPRRADRDGCRSCPHRVIGRRILCGSVDPEPSLWAPVPTSAAAAGQGNLFSRCRSSCLMGELMAASRFSDSRVMLTTRALLPHLESLARAEPTELG